MDEKKMRAAEARKRYDAKNMGVVAVKMKKDEVEAFKTLADAEGISASKKLSGYIREELAQKGKTQTYVPAVLTARNADRLKHETAFHNPKNLNPDELMNDILGRYFKWLDEARA